MAYVTVQGHGQAEIIIKKSRSSGRIHAHRVGEILVGNDLQPLHRQS